MITSSASPLPQTDRCESYSSLNVTIERRVPQFEEIVKGYVRFHLSLWILLTFELVGLLFFSTLLLRSSFLSIAIALFFFSLFSYFILRVYFYSQKPEEFLQFVQNYTEDCKKLLKYQEGVFEHHLALANAYGKLAYALQGKESSFYQLPIFKQSLSSWMEKFSAFWHWHDFHKMKELLLISSVEEHIKLVRLSPTSLELHAALANAFVMLSGLYINAVKQISDKRPFNPPKAFIDLMEKKFREVAERAMEEFKILNVYAPDDLWVHAQLAYSYRDLEMPKEEIREYETMMKLNPEDLDTLFKLGTLYFEQGMNARGLVVFEELKKANYKKADQLIDYYGKMSRVVSEMSF